MRHVNKVKDWLTDGLKALGIGLIASGMAGMVLFLCGFIFSHFTLLSGLEVAKNGLLLVVVIGLFLIAGMLMVKGKKPEKWTQNNGWKKHFQLMGYKTVMGIICIAVLLVASLVDYVILLFK